MPSTPPRRVLMIAFHFPPLAGSSGIQRTLRFVQHLPRYGWQPLVLSAHPRAYAATADDLLAEIPSDTVVKRAFALDTARHLALAGRYPGRLALPDRWSSWAWGGVPAGLALIRRFRPDVIWSTYPIASAHLLALRLHRWSGIPWVADFRDPMVQDGYPADPRAWRSFQRVEQATLRHAAKVVFVTRGAREYYLARYGADTPSLQNQLTVIENGYDESSFVGAATLSGTPSALNPGGFTLLHSGIVYPSERDPSALFTALAGLREQQPDLVARLRIRFRAPVHAELLQRLATQTQTQALIEVLPAIGYREALQEMRCADGLLVMQGANCNEQIPAKLYEYLRARRPILGLADPAGDTGKTLLEAGVPHVACLENTAQVQAVLKRYLAEVPALAPPLLMSDHITAMSREARTQALAQLLTNVAAGFVE